MKKSGLADSPFFTKPIPLSQASVRQDGKAAPIPEQTQEVFKRTDAQPHEHTTAQPLNRTNEHLIERTPAQMSVRTDAQMHIRTNAQPSNTGTNSTSRTTTRESFDIYIDQLEAFEELRLRLKKQRGKHITKGELMRELLEEILQTKK